MQEKLWELADLNIRKLTAGKINQANKDLHDPYASYGTDVPHSIPGSHQLVASKDTSESHVLISENLKSTVTKLTKQYLSTEHSVLQKAVSDLSLIK